MHLVWDIIGPILLPMHVEVQFGCDYTKESQRFYFELFFVSYVVNNVKLNKFQIFDEVVIVGAKKKLLKNRGKQNPAELSSRPTMNL